MIDLVRYHRIHGSKTFLGQTTESLQKLYEEGWRSSQEKANAVDLPTIKEDEVEPPVKEKPRRGGWKNRKK